MEKEQLQKGQQGSGAAEALGKDRSVEWNNSADASEQEQAAIAADIHESRDKIADIKGLGGLSGADDNAGGSGDGMEKQNTGQPTDI